MDDTSEDGEASDGHAPARACDDRPAARSNASATEASAPQTGTGRWVESSWDLRRGLTVKEGLPADPGLDEWIEALVRGPAAEP